MSGQDHDDNWQARTHIIRVAPMMRPKTSGNDCLVIIYSRDNAHLGRRTVLNATTPTTVGRGEDNTIKLDSDTASRRHARFEQRSGAWWVVDQQSTNGTYVNDDPVEDARELRVNDQIKIGDTIFKYLTGDNIESEFLQTIGAIMVTDGLTKAHNRKHLTEHLEKEFSRTRRHGNPLSLVMFDLDKFKGINDTYGHLAGDYVLREVAAVVRGQIDANSDAIFARYGGEEFSVLMPETELQRAADFAERVRKAIAAHQFVFDNERIPVTISMGVAQADPSMNAYEEFVKIADQRLYAAKHGGRNRVVAS